MQTKDLLVNGDMRVVGDIYSSSLDFIPTLTSGTQIGTIKMNGKTTNIFAPVGGGVASGSGSSLTYSLSKSGSTITLTGSDGSTSSVTDANSDINTTYRLSKSGSTITLTGSDGSTTSVTDSDTNTHPSDYVNIAGAQTITGLKTFSNSLKIGSATISYDSTNKALVITL